MMTKSRKCDKNRKRDRFVSTNEKTKYYTHINIVTMRKFNVFRSKVHRESSHQTKPTTTLKTNFKPYTTANIDKTIPTQAITISAPIINSSDKVAIDNKDQSNETSSEEHTSESDNTEEEIAKSEEPKIMSDEDNHTDDQVD
jgi:hypothetical protein